MQGLNRVARQLVFFVGSSSHHLILQLLVALRESRVATFLEFSFLINKVENILVNVQHVGLAASSGIMEWCLKKGSVGETQRSSDDPCCPERDETGMVRAFPWWFCLVSSGLSGLD